MLPNKKIEITNRKGQKIIVLLSLKHNQKGLAFVMHGLGGFKEQPHIETFAESFFESGYTVVRFDTTNTFGESDGNYENATTTNYYEDLEDVIEWTKLQHFYQEPFCLCGHSLGGISTTLYSEKFPVKVKALAPISSVISGKLHHEEIPSDELEEYEKTGWKIAESKSKPGVIKKLNWHNFSPDLQKYDLLSDASKLTMPILLIVGDLDKGTPFKHQEILYNHLSGPKEIHVIRGAAHTFRDEDHLKEIKEIMVKWISSFS